MTPRRISRRRKVLTMSDELTQDTNTEEEIEEKTPKQIAKERRAEIKRLLLCNFAFDANDKLIAGSGGWITPFGIGDGAGQTIAFGIKEKRYSYTSSLKNAKQTIFKVSKAMENTGRSVVLQSAPDAAVCYVKSLIFRPVVLLFEQDPEGEGFKLHTYCGRSPIAFVAVMRAVSRFEKQLPDDIKRKT